MAVQIHDEGLDRLEDRLGYRFREPTLLLTALTHRSWSAEHDNVRTNERLEFLGDAVLGWVIADLVYDRFPDLDEGSLTDLRKGVVNAAALAGVARSLQIGAYLRLGRGEDKAGGNDKTSILSDALEAILGAVYLDGGVASVTEIIEREFVPLLDAAAPNLDHLDEKTALQELAAHRDGLVPVYSVEASGPDHERRFRATVTVGEVSCVGEGTSKKAAEQAAAAAAVAVLNTESNGR